MDLRTLRAGWALGVVVAYRLLRRRPAELDLYLLLTAGLFFAPGRSTSGCSRPSPRPTRPGRSGATAGGPTGWATRSPRSATTTTRASSTARSGWSRRCRWRSSSCAWSTDDDQQVTYGFEELDELLHAYAVTVHRSQGSEYPCVVVPLTTSAWLLLQRNLLYTAITRAKRLVVLVGSRRALAKAVRTDRAGRRWTTLAQRLGTPSPPYHPTDGPHPDQRQRRTPVGAG